ncbi:ribosomal protein S18 [Kwoniella shandongensis]|uniref:Small ribosomal subunit protein bS18m n=1 Tax=Kwoniella shandongensis TaxID=1734106 RepID=A0A5M6C2Y6_9TREE|nr:ribosomal protein S18 [Kwoniella shandongensis]KAA5529517.1 ribosomal protein S18 [Kwoniella shandongensis]
MSRQPLSVRLLHTSLPHRRPAAQTPRDVLSSYISSKSSASSSSTDAAMSSGSTTSAARKILESLSKTARTEVDDKRRPFRANTYAPPSTFTQSALYPTPRPYPRPPLLGPPKKVAARIDPFHLTKTSPLDHDLNPLFALAFVSPMGKIKGRAETGLTWKSQRKVGKLVRRARAMGLISRWRNELVPGGLGSPQVGTAEKGRYT